MSVDLSLQPTEQPQRTTSLRESGVIQPDTSVVDLTAVECAPATSEQVTQSSGTEPNPGHSETLQTGAPVVRSKFEIYRDRTLGNVPVLFAVLVLAVVIAWALVPAWFSGHDPIKGIPADKLQAPSVTYWFGTDHIGRDLFSRVVHGTELTLTAAAIAIVIGLSAGALLGLIAGFMGGRLDGFIMRIMDVLLAIPGLLLSLAIVTALGFGTVKVAIAVGAASIPTFARVMRAQVLKVRHATYVEAAELTGVSHIVILFRHVLPNASAPVLVLAAVEFGAVILSVSALSFLGFGATPPDPEWGSLISEGRNYFAGAWWYSILPGLVILIFVLSVNVVGRALQHQEKLS